MPEKIATFIPNTTTTASRDNFFHSLLIRLRKTAANSKDFEWLEDIPSCLQRFNWEENCNFL
jgi:hypothetical protein